MIEDFVSLVAVQAHAKQLEIVCFIEPDVPAELRGGASRIRQILSNLIGNAIKFTKRGEVIVRVSRVPAASCGDEERTCTLRISIRDTGIGIPSDKMGLLKTTKLINSLCS